MESKTQSTFQSQCGTDLDYSVAIHSKPVGGVTHVQSAYFLTYRLADSGCSSNIEWAKYLTGQRSKICMVNGQTTERELVKVLTRSRSCDYRVYGSDTPLKHACSSKDEGSLPHKTEMLL